MIMTLLNGKLYRCPFSANTMNLNAIPIKDNEYIDLEKTQTSSELKKEIIDLYHKPEYLTVATIVMEEILQRRELIQLFKQKVQFHSIK